MHEILKQHFLNPRNMGQIEHPTHTAVAKSDSCSDIVKLAAVIEDGLVKDIRAEIFGCGYAIAGTSFFTDAVRGRRLDEVPEIVERELGGLLAEVPEKHHGCIRLGSAAFHRLVPSGNRN